MNTAQAIDRVREAIRRQHKALSTEDSYLPWLRQYMGALRSMPPDLSSEKKLEKFLTGLARHRNVSPALRSVGQEIPRVSIRLGVGLALPGPLPVP